MWNECGSHRRTPYFDTLNDRCIWFGFVGSIHRFPDATNLHAVRVSMYDKTGYAPLSHIIFILRSILLKIIILNNNHILLCFVILKLHMNCHLSKSVKSKHSTSTFTCIYTKKSILFAPLQLATYIDIKCFVSRQALLLGQNWKCVYDAYCSLWADNSHGVELITTFRSCSKGTYGKNSLERIAVISLYG